MSIQSKGKKTILIIYPYFFPGFKAGGPIQSLVNLIHALSNYYNFKVITSSYDLNDSQPYPKVAVNQWNPVNFGEGIQALIWYNRTLRITWAEMQLLINQATADIIFVNGLFTMWSFLPLSLFRWEGVGSASLIISPRGMLQDGALKSNSFKKRIYLTGLKMMGAFKKLTWHATSIDEKSDIIAKIGASAVVVLAGNIPKRPLQKIKVPSKTIGELRLVYLSLITEKKNLLLLLESISRVKGRIFLSIYGPVKDVQYWKKCLSVIEKLPSHISVIYYGDVCPEQVQSRLAQYHAMILLTKGENFGHSLFESLSVGRPIVTSHFTPWNNLEVKRAGWNIDISNIDKISVALQEIVQADQKVWNEFCFGAWDLSRSYFSNSSFKTQYQELFG